MSETAEERKARLKAMRAEAAMQGEVDTDEGPDTKRAKQEDASSEEPQIKFRNYKYVGQTDPTSAPAPDTAAEEEASRLVEGTEEEDVIKAVVSDQVEDILNLAPRKVDWDLKRDIEDKLGKLERRTQRAIAEILQEQATAAGPSSQ